MARRTAIARYSAPRRSAAAGKLAKFKANSLAAARRGAQAAQQRKGMLIEVACAAGLGYAAKQGMVPPSILGVQSELVVGVGLAILGPMVLKGNTGKLLERAGTAALDIAAYKIAAGAPILGDEGGFGWGGVAGEGGGWTGDNWTGT